MYNEEHSFRYYEVLGNVCVCVCVCVCGVSAALNGLWCLQFLLLLVIDDL